ncbi:phage shock protein operon transcriptional activator [Vibrio mangrovi]|uniref:Phage shock protein operon transcriptional activator n=1 Tax=Vibrio mangrovi TaxID=474394 RepID=A0A1Y6INY7_9VIBR|nr:phage shock protein operon transcriptional activator [Vibrio mangrovi]MDW6003830.1 phage shock protein operon transcriptional activator [Vibrio mangrovi]SMR99375.1 Psp operon transcriptional activator [Vibrio mangrovi]
MKINLIGESPHFLAVLEQVSHLAQINRPVLIMGERGTGKELIAQRIHYLSQRWEHPMISLNCAALSEGLIDSELFGHESGAFTGSKGRHQGRFERAEHGSLFLDELATAPLNVQEKLLRVIEYGEYERVGGSQTLKTDVRLICATNGDLLSLAEQGKFRSDLLDRLAFDVVHLPPLRERREDILLLAEHYAIRMCHEIQLPYFPGFSQQVRETLLDYHWPGNIRELKNVIERAVYRHRSVDHPIDHLILNPFQSEWKQSQSSDSAPPARESIHVPDSVSFPVDFKVWMETQERQVIMQALVQAKYNQRNAALLLGLSYHQLRGLIRKYQLITKNE